MNRQTPEATVIVATRNRADRLAMLLESLRRQTVDSSRFEVIVVDDGSTDATPDLLRAEQAADGLALTSLRRDAASGPGQARNAAWPQAAAPLVAFIDDDCVAAPAWLEAGLGMAGEHPEAIVQGRTQPIPEEEEREPAAFSYTIRVPSLGPHYETCNIFYPRRVLEQMDGFDTEAFPGGGEDADLAWRAIEAGVETVFAADARAYHAVHNLGPIGQLKRAWHWTDTMRAFARHPGLRKAHLFRGLFWKVEHYGLVRLLLLPLIPKRLRLLRRWFAWTYIAQLGHRGISSGRGPLGLLLMPYLVVHDLVELLAVVRGAIRYRTPVL